MAHPFRKVNNPYQYNLLYLMLGLLWGLFAGLGVSFFISILPNRNLKTQTKPMLNRSKDQNANTKRAQTQPSTRGRTTPARRPKNKIAGSRLASTNIQTREQRSSDEPTINDSLGG